MAAIELRRGSVRDRIIELVDAVYMVGSDPESADIVLDDATVSSLHACLERVGRTWLVRDLGSRNGTLVEGKPLSTQRQVRHLETIRIGQTDLVFRDFSASTRPVTNALAGPPPDLTRMERRVLVELCRPILSNNAFQPPASVREIAARLYIGVNAVQAHLTNLYAKFGLPNKGDTNRRADLANEALKRGAVGRGDLEERPDVVREDQPHEEPRAAPTPNDEPDGDG